MGDINPNTKCYHYDGEFCDKCWPALKGEAPNLLAAKIILHQRAYEAIGEPVPPYRCTLMEWEKEWVRLKKIGNVPLGATLLGISEYVGVPIELVVKIN
jgi:hypothetical protein